MKKIAQLTDGDFGISPLSSNAPWKYAIRAILFNDFTKIALSHEKATGLYALVGGGLESNESPAQGLLREMKEETGCKCKIQYPLGYINENRGSQNYRKTTFFFVATVLSEGVISLTAEEELLQQEVLWLSIDSAYKIISEQIYNTTQYKFIQKRDLLALEEYFTTKRNG